MVRVVLEHEAASTSELLIILLTKSKFPPKFHAGAYHERPSASITDTHPLLSDSDDHVRHGKNRYTTFNRSGFIICHGKLCD